MEIDLPGQQLRLTDAWIAELTVAPRGETLAAGPHRTEWDRTDFLNIKVETPGASGETNTNIDMDRNRPLVHFTPRVGFMNDPNGLVYADGLWHLYFQINEKSLEPGNPQWGHATSPDMLEWTQHELAIESGTTAKSIFSGCCVVDKDNTSGLFDGDTEPQKRIVAVYTLHEEGLETQCVSYSTDGGYTFANYKNNPVLDEQSANFRDPKVFWHEASHQWVMVVAKCREYKVGLYGSKNLLEWEHLSDFGGMGVRGFQFEMPDLVEVPYEGQNAATATKWVLLLGINPGAPAGGSFTQYFVGNFDGRQFTADDGYLRVADHGRDWYASQTWFNAPDGRTWAVAWASNWQYCVAAPTAPYRSAQSLPRALSVRDVPLNDITMSPTLIQRPCSLDGVRRPVTVTTESAADGGGSLLSNMATLLRTAIGSVGDGTDQKTVCAARTSTARGGLEFELTVRAGGSWRVSAELANASGNSIELSFLVEADGMYVVLDRGINRTGRAFDHPLFSDRVSMWVPRSPHQTTHGVHAVVDTHLCEVFVDDGSYAFTNVFYLRDGAPNKLTVSYDGNNAQVDSVWEILARDTTAG